jgi:hypothetical protein
MKATERLSGWKENGGGGHNWNFSDTTRYT